MTLQEAAAAATAAAAAAASAAAAAAASGRKTPAKGPNAALSTTAAAPSTLERTRPLDSPAGQDPGPSRLAAGLPFTGLPGLDL